MTPGGRCRLVAGVCSLVVVLAVVQTVIAAVFGAWQLAYDFALVAVVLAGWFVLARVAEATWAVGACRGRCPRCGDLLVAGSPVVLERSLAAHEVSCPDRSGELV